MKPATGLEKPSLLTTSRVFEKCNILVADPDPKIASLVKNILSTLGCNRIFVVNDGQSALALMKENPIDIVITEWTMPTLSGIDLATHLRQSLDSPNRMIPIILLTTHNERTDIETARDAGISEYLVKPFSSKILLERLHAVVEDPRNFILCRTYIGPDRRRISSFTLPPGTDTSRQYIERKPALIVPMDLLKQIVLDDRPRMILPDYTLKQKIGLEVPAELLVNPLTTTYSDEEEQKAQDTYLKAAMQEVDNLETSFQQLISSPKNVKKLVGSIRDTAESIKERAAIFGYIRATEVAGQLANFCRRHFDKDNTYHLIILEKHIQTIAVIFAQKIMGDGGETGRDLMRDLSRLILKYLKHKN